MKSISSPSNPLIKSLLLLQSKSRERRNRGIFLVEGRREIGLAISGGYQPQQLLFCPELLPEDQLKQFIQDDDMEIISISKEVYERLAYRPTTEGVLATFKVKSHEIEKFQPITDNPLILIAEAPEKPGNIGALLRTADAAAADAVIIANPKTDLYNPNIIRGSVGTLFTVSVFHGSTSEIISWLKENNIRIYCAALQASMPYLTVDMSGPTALVVGTEADGLSEQWLTNSDQNIIIPMSGAIDSMNVSVAAGILIFEAKRQRTSP